MYYETERMWNWSMGQKEERGYTMRQKNEGAVETKGNCTFNSSLALVLRYRLDRKVAGTLSDGKIGGVLMSVCMCVNVYCTCFALVP